MHVDVNFLTPDKLKRTQYHFALMESRLVFSGYYEEERQTTRHKWVAKVGWSRLSYVRSSAHTTNWIARPKLDEVIKTMAKQELLQQIEVVESADGS